MISWDAWLYLCVMACSSSLAALFSDEIVLISSLALNRALDRSACSLDRASLSIPSFLRSSTCFSSSWHLVRVYLRSVDILSASCWILMSFSCSEEFSARSACVESSSLESIETSAAFDVSDDSSCWMVLLCWAESDLSFSVSLWFCVLSCRCSSTARRSATDLISSCLFFQSSVLMRASVISLACSACVMSCSVLLAGSCGVTADLAWCSLARSVCLFVWFELFVWVWSVLCSCLSVHSPTAGVFLHSPTAGVFLHSPTAGFLCDVDLSAMMESM